MDLFPPGRQGISGEGHVVLPTEQAAEAAEGKIEHLEITAGALAPNQSLTGGWDEFAVPAEELSLGVEIKERVEKRRVAGLGISFVYPIATVIPQSDAASRNRSVSGPGIEMELRCSSVYIARRGCV